MIGSHEGGTGRRLDRVCCRENVESEGGHDDVLEHRIYGLAILHPFL